MTADEIIPVAISSAQAWMTALSNAYVFDNLSMMDAFVGIFALSIICGLIEWVRTRGQGGKDD